MKKTVLTFGMISGLILSVMIAVTIPFMDRIGFERGEIIGYTSMVVAFLLIFFGVRSYRENVGGGHITFARGLAIGLLITIVASVFYVAMWQVIYYKVAPDFMDKYTEHVVGKLKASGATQADIDAKTREMEGIKRILANPVFNILIPFIEPMPVGLLISLISAGILRKRRPPLETPAPPMTREFA